MLTSKEAIMIARKYNLEYEIRQELNSGLTPEQALEEWDILSNLFLKFLVLSFIYFVINL